jgi:hypothetical protein
MEIQSETLEVIVVGISPLLTRNPLGMVSAVGARGQREIPSPQEEAETSVYRLPDGSCGLPTMAFRSCLIKAAAGFKAPKGRASLKGAASHIQMTTELISILDVETLKPVKTFEIDSRRVVIQKAGIIRNRPRFEKWAAKVGIIFDPTLIAGSVLRDILADGGTRIGVGDYRPERGGPMGRFAVRE